MSINSECRHEEIPELGHEPVSHMVQGFGGDMAQV